ncbi:Gfo/Idh/MocA family oxidoreductase [Fodinibius roseus]|nr:Gfo/Idh/MocA family oxidoreductase [Fodinibius roseus]
MNRRTFLKKGTAAAGGMIAAPAFIRNLVSDSPNERINVAVVGISGERPRVRGIPRGRGMRHILGYAQCPNVRVTAVCDVDERLFPAAVKETEKLYGTSPKTVIDYRELLDDSDIDVVSLATPNHWHALQTIWACQAGKDVYCEKPVSHNISEGRKMVQAANKYERVVLAGMTRRFDRAVHKGVQLLHKGKLGTPYMAKSIIYAYRESIGKTPDSSIPEGVHWDKFLGPAPYRPFNKNRFLYNWHWMWDTGNGDIANLGIYELDVARWALEKETHPVSVHSSGGVYGRDSDRETPNVLTTHYEYEDGMLLQSEVRSLYTNYEGGSPRTTIIYTDEGWMEINGGGYRAYVGREEKPAFSLSADDVPEDETINGWQEFIDCIRYRNIDSFRNNIIEGHRSAALCHLANISHRTGRKLQFDPDTEKFVNDPEANGYLYREYRAPYLMPETI